MTTYEELERRWEALEPEAEKHLRAVLALHRKVVRYYADAYEGYSWESEEEAREWLGEDLPVTPLHTFELCEECSRMERDTLTEQGGDGEWGYLASEWPCRTATALGIA